MESLLLMVLNLTGIYMLIGILFSILFLWRGVDKVDKDAGGSGWSFRLLLLPGLMIFWPLFLLRWLKLK